MSYIKCKQSILIFFYKHLRWCWNWACSQSPRLWWSELCWPDPWGNDPRCYQPSPFQTETHTYTHTHILRSGFKSIIEIGSEPGFTAHQHILDVCQHSGQHVLYPGRSAPHLGQVRGQPLGAAGSHTSSLQEIHYNMELKSKCLHTGVLEFIHWFISWF